jgi:hypothetical protein
MIKSPLLRAPGTAGVYDPRTNTTGLSFDFEDLFPKVFHPTPESWRKNLAAIHEWVHFYQFATTTYGFLYQALTFAQAYMVNGFLTLYQPRKKRCHLPLIKAGEALSIKKKPKWSVHLRAAYLLEDLRKAVYGYAPFPESFSPKLDEWQLIGEVLNQVCGTPKIYITQVPDGVPASGALRYRIDDLLEAHAHVLSSMWLMQTVEQYGLPRRITEAVVEHANKVAVGPYKAFLEYELPVPEKHRMYTICALCDIALNPPGFHFEETKGQLLLFPDQVWSPVERMWRYLHMTIQGDLPVPERTEAGFEWQYLESVKEALKMEGNYVLPFSGSAEGKLEDLRKKSLGLLKSQDVPLSLSLTWLDRIQTFSIASSVREEFPLILAGNHVQDLELLTRSVGGPIVISDLPDRQRFFPRVCTGLLNLGLLEDPTSTEGEMAIRSGIAELEAIGKLLYMSNREAEQVADESLFLGCSLREFLEGYGLKLEDFD